jgi:hypothetical protein
MASVQRRSDGGAGDRTRPKAAMLPIPQPFGELISGVLERDADWFAQHPGEQYVVRPYVPGEGWPQLDAGGDAVLVIQIAPGVRVRRGIQVHFNHPIPERIPVLLEDRVVVACVAEELRR